MKNVEESIQRAATRTGATEPRRASLVPFALVGAIAAAIGAVLAWALDPQLGRTRRALTRDRVAGGLRRIGRASGRRGRWVSATASGLARRIEHADSEASPVDEVGLVDRVRSRLFRDEAIDKGAISINAERDVVYLRGTAGSTEEILEIEGRVSRIDGVRRVVNLLHVPGSPVPVMDAAETAQPAAIQDR